MFWPVLATVAIIYVCNATLAMRQMRNFSTTYTPVSYTHLRAHETGSV